MATVGRVIDVRLNQTEITLGFPVLILLASYYSTLFCPALRLIIKLPNQTRRMTGLGKTLHRLCLGVLDRHGFGLLVRRQTGNVLDAAGIASIDKKFRVESGVTAKNDEIIWKRLLKAFDQSFEFMLQHLSDIVCSACTKTAIG